MVLMKFHSGLNMYNTMVIDSRIKSVGSSCVTYWIWLNNKSIIKPRRDSIPMCDCESSTFNDNVYK